MIVALTVFSGDAAAALRLLEWIKDLGGVGYHNLVLGTTPKVNPAPLLAVARESWGTVEHFTIATQNEAAGWPAGPNGNFLAVCEHLKSRNRPFFFLEADCVPICSNWLDQLEREYLMVGLPFMGVVHSMMNPATGKQIPDTEHMTGSGIYPANLHTYLPTLPFVTGPLSNQPWDVALRWEMLYLVDGNGGFRIGPNQQRVNACHPTEKICFCWRTVNYRVEDDRLFYDTIGPAHHKRIDFDRHVLHHGCKDDSLLKVLRARLFPSATQPPASLPQGSPDVPDASKGDQQKKRVNPRLPAAAFKVPPPTPRTIAKKRRTKAAVKKRTRAVKPAVPAEPEVVTTT